VAEAERGKLEGNVGGSGALDTGNGRCGGNNGDAGNVADNTIKEGRGGRMKHIKVNGTTFDMYYKRRTNEWVVRVRKDGKRMEGRCYYTDDKEDAIETMMEMVKEEGTWQKK
jgi:hypothetical protein